MKANNIKVGDIIVFNNELCLVVKPPEHIKPGKGPAYVQVKMRNLKSGSMLNQRLSSTSDVEKAFIDTKEMEYSYAEGENLVFIDPETFDQLSLSKGIMENKLPLLTEDMVVQIEFYQDNPINIKLPQTAVVEIENTDPVIKGATVTSSYKPAILVNGLKTSVPPYLVIGDKIVIKTEDLTFVERAK